MKMDQAQFYRARAQAERDSADRTQLPHDRDRHLQSAQVWDQMADKIERTILLKVQNDRLKRAKPAGMRIIPRSRVNRAVKGRAC